MCRGGRVEEWDYFVWMMDSFWCVNKSYEVGMEDVSMYIYYYIVVICKLERKIILG